MYKDGECGTSTIYKPCIGDFAENDWIEYKSQLLTQEEKTFLEALIKYSRTTVNYIFKTASYIKLMDKDSNLISEVSINNNIFCGIEYYTDYSPEELGLDL